MIYRLVVHSQANLKSKDVRPTPKDWNNEQGKATSMLKFC